MKVRLLLASILALFFALPAVAGEKEDAAKIKAVMAKIIPNSEPDVISPSALPGIYEVVFGAQIMYVSANGRYVVQGDLIDLEKRENLTEHRRTGQRKELVKKLDEKEMIVFTPKGESKYTITVFTDIDCGYCRKLHREMQTYLDKGIKVRYMSYPRSGVNTDSYFKAVSVWCSDNKQEAMTKAKAGEKPERKDCENPVKKHMELADDFGVSGTPTIVLESGEVVPGYVPADRLLSILKGV